MAAAVAGPEPDMAAKNMDATMAAIPNPPGMVPVSISATSTSFFAMPPLSIRLPTSIKNGIAISENESMLVTVDCASICVILLPALKTENVATQLNPRLTAMGTVPKRHTNNTPSIVPIIPLPPPFLCS